MVMADESADCGWAFLIGNIEKMAEMLQPAAPAPLPAVNTVGGNSAVGFAAAGPAPRVKIRWGGVGSRGGSRGVGWVGATACFSIAIFVACTVCLSHGAIDRCERLWPIRMLENAGVT